MQKWDLYTCIINKTTTGGVVFPRLRLPAKVARRARWLARWLRFTGSLHVFLFVLLPAMLFSVLGAAVIKWLPSAFNYSCVQSDASWVRGLFASAPAGIIVGGGIIFGLTFYRLVIGREYDRLSMFRPIPAILFGAAFALLSGLTCVLLIAQVLSPGALQQIGWTDSASRLPFSEVLHGLFVTNRCGYAFPVTCVGLGIALAMMTNRLRASKEWREFLDGQSGINGLRQGLRVIGRLTLLTLPFAWPIVVLTSLFGAFSWAIMQSAPASQAWKPAYTHELFFGGMDRPVPPELLDAAAGGASGEAGRRLRQQFQDSEVARRTEWKKSGGGRALGLLGDVLSKIVGGYFGVVGMGLGIVVLRHGLKLDPQRGQR